MYSSRGEISTILVAGVIVIIGAATFLTTTLNQERQTTGSQAAGECPLVSIELDTASKSCKVVISYTPGNPEPAAPNSIACALINPERGSDSQLIAGQGQNPGRDFFSKTNTGTFPLTPESDWQNRLSPDSNSMQRLVAYDWNNSSCVREKDVATSVVTALFGGGGVAPTTPPQTQPTTPPQTQPTTPPQNNTPPPSNPTPTRPWYEKPDIPLATLTPTPTIASCHPGQIKCPGTNRCVENQGDCTTTIYLPIWQGGGSPTPTRTPIQLFLPNSPTPTPIRVYLPIFNQQGNVTRSGVVTVETATVSDACYIRPGSEASPSRCSSYVMNRSDWNNIMQ